MHRSLVNTAIGKQIYLFNLAIQYKFLKKLKLGAIIMESEEDNSVNFDLQDKLEKYGYIRIHLG